MRSVSFSHSSLYVHTDSLHFLLNAAMPYVSISFFDVSPSFFSTSSSTGRPCVSHPPFRSTRYPCMVRKRGIKSLNARASAWWMPGLPFAVGGPSKKTNFFPFLVCSSVFSNTFSFSQNANTSSSSLGKFGMSVFSLFSSCICDKSDVSISDKCMNDKAKTFREALTKLTVTGIKKVSKYHN